MRTENNPANEAKATNPDQSRPDAVSKSKVVKKRKVPPVFKIRAVVSVWRPCEEIPRTVLKFEEVRLGSNQEHMRAQVRDEVKFKLRHFGIALETVDIEIDESTYLAAQTRDYSGSIFDDEPAWVDAVTYTCNDLDREKAICALTYLPENYDEQVAVYG